MRQGAMEVPKEKIGVIREAIHEMHTKKKGMQTLNGILCRLKDRKERRGTAWTWGRATLHKFMGRMALEIGNRLAYYELPRERPEKIEERVPYL